MVKLEVVPMKDPLAAKLEGYGMDPRKAENLSELLNGSEEKFQQLEDFFNGLSKREVLASMLIVAERIRTWDDC